MRTLDFHKCHFIIQKLDEESSYLTTFNITIGRYRFTVIPFGVVFAQEVFHKTVNEKFHEDARQTSMIF